jgi:hypothetical protein
LAKLAPERGFLLAIDSVGPQLGDQALPRRQKNCVRWDRTLADSYVHKRAPDKILLLSAFPPFVVVGLAVQGLRKLGISQVSSFMLLMPILIFAWHYFVSWLLDRLIRARPKPSDAISELKF